MFKKLIFIVIFCLTFTVGCAGLDKQTEQFNDAPRGTTNNAPADIVTFPDGFSNVATKCDNGNRIYVIFKHDANYGAISVVEGDPTCNP